MGAGAVSERFDNTRSAIDDGDRLAQVSGFVDGVHGAAGVVIPEGKDAIGSLYDKGIAHNAGFEAVCEPVGVVNGQGDAVAFGIAAGLGICAAGSAGDDLGEGTVTACEGFDGFYHHGKIGKAAGAYDSEFHG